MSAGIGAEWNMNSPEYFAGGAVLDFQYNLPLPLFMTVGLSVTASTSFDSFMVLEPAALFRWYVLGVKYSGLFAQADVGASLLFDQGNVIPLALGGIRMGYRIPLGKSLYVEAYGRGGYPFAFGMGAMAGFRFQGKTVTQEPAAEEPIEAEDPPAPVADPPPAHTPSIETALRDVYARHRTDIILNGAIQYTVKSGDTLVSIARVHYRNGFDYPLIMLASDGVTDIDQLEVGMVLTIPNLDINLRDPVARASIKACIEEVAAIEDSRGRRATARGLWEAADAL